MFTITSFYTTYTIFRRHVHAAMNCMGNYFKVFHSIVEFVPVFMVNIFFVQDKFSTNKCFHQPAMFWNLMTITNNKQVSIFANAACSTPSCLERESLNFSTSGIIRIMNCAKSTRDSLITAIFNYAHTVILTHLFSSGLTIFSVPTKWELPLPPNTIVECPCCSKSYEMGDKIPSGVRQATATCIWCGEAMEIYVDRYGNMKSVWRQKSYL